MLVYYLIFVVSYALEMVYTFFIKRYQTTAGTSGSATAAYLLVNGICIVVISVLAIALTGQEFQISGFSIVIAFAVVAFSAFHTLGTLKAYEKGKIAIVGIFSRTGNILLSCLWGVLFLNEHLSLAQWGAIAIIVASVLIVIIQKNGEFNRSIFWLLVVITVLQFLTDAVSKYHQVNVQFQTVNILSFTMWMGVCRTILALLVYPFAKKRDSTVKSPSAKMLSYGAIAASANIVCFMGLLFAAKALPIALTAPLGSALSISFTTILAWIVYKEKMTPRQIAGIVLCTIGIFLYSYV